MVPFALCLDELPVHFIHLKRDSGLDHTNWLPESSCTKPKTGLAHKVEICAKTASNEILSLFFALS